MFRVVEIDAYIAPGKNKNGTFLPGCTPANKGKKMPADIKQRVAHTFFQKGHLPHNTKSDGVITTRKDKRGVPQLFIRLEKAKWQYYKIYIYEQHHGPISKGDVIRFIDGNTLNCSIDNLQKITQADNLRLNRILSNKKQIDNHG